MTRMRPLALAALLAGVALAPAAVQALKPHRAHAQAALLEELAALPPAAPYGAFLHFSRGTRAEQDATIARLGLRIHSDFRRHTDSVYVTGPAASFQAALLEPSIYYVEHNAPLQLDGDTGPWATRARVAQEPVAGGPFRDAAGNILDGRGIGVGIIDSGANAVHPDLADRVGTNFKIECAPVDLGSSGCVFEDVGNTASTDLGGGHGTHVAGIVAGDGTASTPDHGAAATPNVPGSFTGVAPGATLHVFSTGEGLNILYAVEAIQYIIDHYDEFEPRIRVTNHSYGQNLNLNPADATRETNPYNENDTERQLARILVQQKGVVMVYSAGNNGPGTHANGPGNLRRTNASCGTPYLGLMCVANYDDAGTGAQDNALSSDSSRAKLGEEQYYPDLAAPGSNITATCGPGAGAVCQSGDARWGSQYGTIGGTSMAAPHVAGTVALIRQARPELTPAQIQSALQNTARKVTFEGPYESDEENVGGTHNYAVGAGLLDVPAVLTALGIASDGLPSSVAPAEVVVADADADAAAGGAADIVRVTWQETARGAVTSGVTFRLTLRDAADFVANPAVAYQVQYNVGGQAFSTRADADADGVAPAAAGGDNNAVASAVTRAGNVVTLFVPHSRLGNPAVGTPVHNIRARAFDPDDASTLDTAPSVTGSTGSVADQQPAFGRPATVLRPATVGAPSENACVAPGLTQLEDPQGDIFALVEGAPGNPGAPAYDLRKLSVVQPYVAPPADYTIEFHLKVQSLATVPAAVWPVNFCSPAFPCINPDVNTAAYGANNKYYTVEMSTSAPASPAAPVFQVRAPNAAGVTAASRTVTNITGQGSGFTPDGLIKLVVKASQIGLVPANAGAESLSKFQVRVRADNPTGAGTSGPTPDNMPDGLAGIGRYDTLPLTQCDPGNAAPVAQLAASPASGAAPLTVTYTVGASDPGDTIVKYVLSFGDDTSQEVPAPSLPATVTHTYTEVGAYTARLFVTDSHQRLNDNDASQAITVTAEPDNVAPTAALAASPTSGHGPLTVTLDGGASADTDGSIVEYRFTPGDGSPEVRGSAASITHEYARAGTYRASLVVVDDAGAASAAATSDEIVVENEAPVAVLAATPESGAAPLTVQLSGTGSSDPDGDALANFRFDCGNGVIRDGAAATASCPYETPGTYTAALVVTDSLGTDSAPATREIQVGQGQPSFTFIERTGVATSTFVTSETRTVTGYAGVLPISIDNGGQYRIDAGAWTAAPGQIAAGSTLAVRHVSADTPDTAKVSTVTVGGYSTPFKTTTASADRTPDAFGFATQAGVAPGALVESDTVVPAGYNTPAPVVPGPGLSYRVAGGPWTTASGSIAPGQSLQVRHTASSRKGEYTRTQVKVGGVTATFTTRTQ